MEGDINSLAGDPTFRRVSDMSESSSVLRDARLNTIDVTGSNPAAESRLHNSNSLVRVSHA